MSEQEPMHPPQEPDLLAWKWITGVTTGVIVLTVVLSLVAAWAVHRYQDHYGGWAHRENLATPKPELWPNTELEYELFEAGPGEGQRLRAADQAQLESWGWVDREAEVVRIPIDEAIDLVAEGQP